MDIRYFSDHLNNTIPISFPPQRIISLVPSQTELLADLGLDACVCGITKFCIHPNEWMARKRIVGGTKKFNMDVINSLNPDLILANKEENYKEGIEQLKKRYPVWVSDINTWEDSLRMIKGIGEITDRSEPAERMVQAIESSFLSTPEISDRFSVLYLIWRNPWMGAGTETYIHSMLEKAGFSNSLAMHKRYPELSMEQIQALSPDLIFLSSEPYPFKENHVGELQLISPGAKVILVDGEMFSWYGSRQLLAASYFRKLVDELPDKRKAK